jgi:hypothetical protein
MSNITVLEASAKVLQTPVNSDVALVSWKIKLRNMAVLAASVMALEASINSNVVQVIWSVKLISMAVLEASAKVVEAPDNSDEAKVLGCAGHGAARTAVQTGGRLSRLRRHRFLRMRCAKQGEFGGMGKGFPHGAGGSGQGAGGIGQT